MNYDSPHVRWSPYFYSGLMALAIVAFWPGYLAAPKLALSGWTHFHAVTGTLWLLLLIAQPAAIRSEHRRVHVLLGRIAYVLAPLVLVGFVGLAHSSMQGKSLEQQAVDAYFFYIRCVLVAIFAGCYLGGVIHRHKPEVHSVYMLCTGLPLIDPVLHRIAQRAMGGADVNYQLLTFGVPCAILIALYYWAKHSSGGRRALMTVLAAFVVSGVPLAFDFYKWGALWTMWKAVSQSFAALPLT